LPGTKIVRAPSESAIGALRLAGLATPRLISTPDRGPSSVPVTEIRNPRTTDLDKQSVSQLIDTMLHEEARVIPALRAHILHRS
jgi:hypothetical protein